MEANAAQRTILVSMILVEADLLDRLKSEFPYNPPVNFELTGDVFMSFGCDCLWRGAEWDGTSARILCNLFAKLRRHVRFVRTVQNLCAQFVRDVETFCPSYRT